MDLAVYIGELLKQQGALSIPGLGKFSQVRKHGFYAEDAGVFYPPHYETNFEEQATADDSFAQYISSKKNISITSAKYFVEKYITQLKQQATEDETLMDQLGWMRASNGTLNFRPNTAASTFEQEYFGLPALQVNKIWEQLSGYRRTTPVIADIASAPSVEAVTPAPTPELAIFPEVLSLRTDTPAPVKQQQVADEETTTDEAAPKSGMNIWILLLIIFTVAGIILLALYQYKPALFNNRLGSSVHPRAGEKHQPVQTPPAVVNADTVQNTTIPADTAAKTSVIDTPVATTAPAVAAHTDTAKAKVQAPVQPQAQVQAPANIYQIAGGAFVNMEAAEKAITNYKSIGITARVIENKPGRKVKLGVGTYTTYAEAQAKMQELLTAHKVPKDAYVIRPKK